MQEQLLTTSIMRNRTHCTMKLLVLLGVYLARADGFATTQNARNAFTSKRKPTAVSPGKSLMSMFLDDFETLPNFDLPVSTSIASPGRSVVRDLPSYLVADSSVVKAELMNGAIHATLDFTALWGAATLAIRSAAVIGRVLVVASDVSNGREVLPDELAFQFGLLVIACNALANSALPKIKASLAPPLLTSQDRHAFRALFRPAGITWNQFKELNLCAMDWVTLEKGQIITSDEIEGLDGNDAVFWLYQGDVEIHSNDKLLHDISRLGKSQKDSHAAGLGLLGEMRLAKLLDGQNSSKKTKNKTTGEKKDESSRRMTAIVGESGATLLRMNTTKIEKLLKHDQELTNSVNRLVFKGMQDKLNALLLKP
jgi:hypothetical protein